MTGPSEQFWRAVWTPVWFGQQAVVVGGLGFIWFVLFACAMLALMAWKAPRTRGAWVRLSPLLLLPIIWYAAGAWGGWFWREGQEPPNPEWVVSQVPLGLLILAVTICAGTVAWASGARVFAFALSVLALYFILVALFMAGMALTGTWL